MSITGSWRIHGPTYDVRVVTSDCLGRDEDARRLPSDVLSLAVDEWLAEWGCQVPLKDILLACCSFDSCGLDLSPGSALHERARLLLRTLFVGGRLAAIDQGLGRARNRRGMSQGIRPLFQALKGGSNER